MAHKQHHEYHLVDPSPWPFLGALSGFTFFLGFVFAMHDFTWAGIPFDKIVMPIGFLMILYTMYVWWRDVIYEGEVGKHHSEIVRAGLRLGMVLFILSEVMFFFAFFWSFFKAALDPVLLFDGSHVLESEFLERGVWPPATIQPFDAWDLPLMNTLILLLSGTTVTWAHYGLLNGDRDALVKGLWATVILGISFTGLQAYEYGHAAFCMSGLFDQMVASFGIGHGEVAKCAIANDHVYPSNFFMATGFHGAHVLIGTIFLAVCLYRAQKGAMTPEGHLGFEFAAWYWHFVDVVWLFLFVFVYVWGA